MFRRAWTLLCPHSCLRHVIFNPQSYDDVYSKETRKANAIDLREGQPMGFGANNEFGLMQDGFGIKVVKLGENGITEKDLLIHDPHTPDPTLHLQLARKFTARLRKSRRRSPIIISQSL